MTDNKLKSDVLIGTGSISPFNQRYITELIEKRNFKTVLEIGTHIGKSGEAILKGLEHHGGIGTHFDTVDIVDVNSKDTKKYEKYKPEIMPADIFKNYLTPYFFHSNGSDEFFKNNIINYDFIFIDGGHKREQVERDIVNAFNFLSPGGLILLHDYYPENKPLFVDRKVISGPYLAVENILTYDPGIDVIPLGTVYGQVTSFCILKRKG